MARSTCEGEGEKGGIGNGTGMEDREEEIREGLGKEGVDVRLVWPVLDYGVEIWGWKERVKVEAIEERFMRWVLGMEGRKHVWEGCRDWGREKREVGRKKWRGF